MIENPMELRGLTVELATAALTFSTLGVLFESGIFEALREPRTSEELAAGHPWLARTRIEHCLGLAAAVGVVARDGDRYRLAPGLVPVASGPMRAAVQGEIRAGLMQALAFLDSSARKDARPGWHHSDPVLLQAQGDSSAMFPPMFKNMIVPQLGDLAERLARPGARFLDVGVGVAALSIGMCRMWPELRCVGVDVYDTPLAIARDNIARAELGARIELRHVGIEHLVDEQGFDFAWLPSFFMPREHLPAALGRIHAAMKPGGWVVTATINPTTASRQCSAMRLLADLWGGSPVPQAEAEAMLATAGFSHVRMLPGPPGGGLFVAQR